MERRESCVILLILGTILFFSSTAAVAEAGDATARRVHTAMQRALQEERQGHGPTPENAAERALQQQLSSVFTKGREPAIQCKSGDGDVCTCTTGCWATADRCACA